MVEIEKAITFSNETIMKLVHDNKKMQNDLIAIKNMIQLLVISKPGSINHAQAKPSTYASTLKSKDVVIVEPRDAGQTFETTRDAVVKVVNPVDSGICGVKKGVNGKIVIECQSKSDSDKVRIAADAALGNNYLVKTSTKRSPIVRIYGLRTSMSECDLISALQKQNQSLFSTNCKLRVLHKFEVKKPESRFGYKREVDPESFNLLIAAGSVCVGWDKCWVNEDFNLLRCFKCWGFHHTSKNCPDNKRCFKCAEEHESSECESLEEKCCACTSASATNGLDLDTAHNAKSKSCPTYLHKIELERRNINYV